MTRLQKLRSDLRKINRQIDALAPREFRLLERQGQLQDEIDQLEERGK